MDIIQVNKFKYFTIIKNLHFEIFQQHRRLGLALDILKPKRQYFIIKIDNQIAGYYAIFENHKYDYIAVFGLKSKFQNQGYGHILMQTIIDNAPGTKLSLHVDTQNKKAYHLYENFGFTIKKELKKFYKNKHNAYFMTKQKDT